MLSLKRNLEEQAAHSALASTPQTTASVIDNASSASGSSKKTSSFYEDYKKRKPSAEPGKMFSLGLTNDFSKKLQKAFENAGKKEKEKPAEKTTFPKNGTDGVITTGNAIKSNIINVLSKKYGELDIRHMFDGIDDKDIEDNISTAENTINTNIDRGFLDKDYSKKLPNLRDGLALSYAAASKGNNKAATKARDAAYTESTKPLLKSTEQKIMSTEHPYTGKVVSGTPEKFEMTNLIDNSDENTEMQSSNEEPEKVNTRVIPEGISGIRFKAWLNNKKQKIIKNQNAYEILKDSLSETDLNAGIKISESTDGNYYYDYTDVIMNRVRKVLPDFSNHKIMSYPEYYEEFSNWLYAPTLQDYYAFCLNDYIFFFNQVNHGAPWDIKRDGPWKQQFGNIKMPYYDSNPDKDEKFLFRGEQVTREDLGNILYGYLGSAMGIDDKTLFWGAGVAANKANMFNGKAYNPDEYYGDNPHDHKYVKKGIELFYEDYPKEKA